MKKYSLSLFSHDLEVKFKEQNFRTHIWVFQQNLFYYGITSALVSMYSFIMGFWIVGIMCSLYVLQLPIIYKIAKRGPFSFDVVCFFFQSTLNLGLPVVSLLGLNNGSISDLDSFLIGQTVTFLFLSQNLGSTFYLKILTILFNMCGQMFMKFYVRKEMTALTILWLGSNLMILNYLYWKDRNKRDAFLIKYNEKLWQQEIRLSAKICIITCVSNRGELILDMNQCNLVSRKEFQIIDVNSLKQFLKNVALIPPKQYRTSVMNSMKSLKEQKNRISLYNQISNFSEQIQCSNLEFIGLYNSCIWEVKIFTTWNDQLLNIHTIMTKSQKEEDHASRKLQYDQKLFNVYRQKFGLSIKTIMIKLQRFSTRKDYLQQLHGSAMSSAYDSLRLNYNLQLYIDPSKYKLNKTNFFLSLLIDKINAVVKNNMPKPFCLNIKCLIDPNLKLYSCQRTIFHIIFNLYSIIVGAAKKSGFIYITAQKRSSLIGSLITFKISTNILQHKLIFKYQNYNENNLHKQDQKFGLEIVVSEYLLGIIGLSRTIKVTDDYLTFTIFQDLSVLND